MKKTTGDDFVEKGTGKFSRRAWGALFVLCGALFLDALDISMIGVALPSIRESRACRPLRCNGP